MKVILNTDVANLGEEGDVCTVSPGYARNFLLPQGLVLEYNDRNREAIDARRADIEARKEEKRRQASTVKQQIEAEPLVVRMTAGANGKLFGSVSSATVVEQLAARGIEVERKKVDMPESTIKTVGNFKVRVRLYGDEEASLAVQVEASNARELEAERAKRGPAASSQTREAPDEAPADDEKQTEEGVSDETLDPEVMAMQAAENEADEATEDSENAEDEA